MSNIIPPLLSDSPPPMVTALDEEEDEFGDFTSAGDASYNYDNYSLPSTPQHGTVTNFKPFDISCNTSKSDVHARSPNIPDPVMIHADKDFQDKRKNCDLESISVTEVNLIEHQSSVNSVHNDSDTYCYNGDTITDQQLPIESVPIDEIPRDHSLNQVMAANSKKDSTMVEVKGNFLISKNKEKNDANTLNIDINVPLTANEIASMNTINDGENNVSCYEVSQDPFSSTKRENNIREDLKIVQTDTKEININDGEVDCPTIRDADNFLYVEEPPDPNIIDDKIENDDFIYYNNYGSDVENEDTSSKLENVRDVNENTISSEKENKNSPNDSLQSTDHENKIEKAVLTNPLCGDCYNRDKVQIDFMSDKCSNDHLAETIENSCTMNSTNNNNSTITLSDHFSCTEMEKLEIQPEGESADKISDLNSTDNTTFITSCDKTADTCEDIAEPIIDTVISPVNEESNSKACETLSICSEKLSDTDPCIEEDSSSLHQNNVLYCRKKDFGDFADFSHSFPESSTNIPKLQVSTSDKISSLSEQLKNSELEDFEDDELYNYGEFIQATTCLPSSTTNTCSSINKENMVEVAEKILLEVFPLCISKYDDYINVEFLSNDQLFNRMKDITEANALSYQWAKSTSQEKLLNALNIDTRNILYGPGWNPMMPKFAANLRTTPLEPVRSEMLTLTPACITNSSPSFTQPGLVPTDVPCAQFDWKGAGLVNPLDSLPPDLQERNQELDARAEHTEKILDFLSHRRNHSDNESVKSLQLTTDIDRSSDTANLTDEFDDFTGYQPSSASWQKNVRLKETYISSEILESKTPDAINTITSSVLTPEVTKVLMVGSAEDEEFTDFQMSLPLKTIDQFNSNVGKVVESDTAVTDILQPIPASEPLKSCLVPKTVPLQPEILWPDPGITSEELLHIELSYSRQTNCDNLGSTNSDARAQLGKKPDVAETGNLYQVLNLPSLENTMCKKTVNKNLEHRGEATDLPNQSNNAAIERDIISVSTKPHQSTTFSLYSNSVHIFTENKTKTNKDDCKHQTNKVLTNVLQPCLVGKENIFTDYRSGPDKLSTVNVEDEWSEFVCNPEPLKYALKPISISNVPERTNTPELQLSIPHLSQLQPPKQPIPVITPHGLIQTKIPSNTSNLNVCQPPSQSSTSRNAYQPSIISQQYQDHLNGPVFPKLPQNGIKVQENLQPKLNLQPYESFGKTNTNDDDDWTEFVSSTPIQQTKTQQKTQRQNYNGWSSNVIPNIITNPTHFDLCNYMSQKPHNSGTVLSFTKSMVPSISALPELDFATPKSKSFKKK